MASELSEEGLTATLEGYNMQVQQLEMALGVTTDRATRMELTMLLRDMKELVDLTQDSLLDVKKQKLMAMLESASSAAPAPSATSTMDAEFAAFQAAIADDIAEPTNDTESAPPGCNGNSADSPNSEEPLEEYPNPFGDQTTQSYAVQESPHSSPDTSHWRPTDGGQGEGEREDEDEEDYPVEYPNPFDDQGGENDRGEREQKEVEEADDGLEDILKDIIGARCRVSYTHDWGELRHHNAMVVGAEPMDGESEPKVRVMFCNPTHRTLVPCPFYLEGRCKFEDDKCRYSHGHVVPVDEIEEFQEVDHSALKLESRCLARYSDDVWYPAVVVEVGEDNQYKVMFDKYDEAEDVEVEDIVPLEDYMEDDGSEDEASSSRFELSDEDDEKDALPVYLWRPNQTTDSLGDWEKHTKGFGSRIMAKMGYITGQGLGMYGEGRAEPVPIQLLPPGKSLDKIMELKELAGDQDLYDVMKRNRRKQKVVDGKVTASYKKVVRQERTTFDFINKKLTGKKGNLSDLMRIGPRGSKVERKTIGAHELTKKSDKHINIQLLKTDEEARNVEKEIKRLKESLQRNDGKGGDKSVAAQVRQRMASMETYLGQLRSSSSSIQRHKQMRSDHKKFTVF